MGYAHATSSTSRISQSSSSFRSCSSRSPLLQSLLPGSSGGYRTNCHEPYVTNEQKNPDHRRHVCDGGPRRARPSELSATARNPGAERVRKQSSLDSERQREVG